MLAIILARWSGILVVISYTTIMAATLNEAMVSAYLTNLQLEARRMQIRGSREVVNQALASWYPSIELVGEEAVGLFEKEQVNTYSLKPSSYASHIVRLVVTQSIYRGGRTLAQVGQAESYIHVDLQQLALIEQTAFLTAATAYLDAWRDKVILDLNTSSEKILQHQLQVVRDRFAAGEATRTDIAQAEVRVARAATTRKKNLGAVEVSKAVYAAVIGESPGELTLPTLAGILPVTCEEVINLAQRNSQVLKAALHTAESAVLGIQLASSERWPSLSMKATFGQTWLESVTNSSMRTIEANLILSFPLYQQGLTASRVREAKYSADWRTHEIESARRQAVAFAIQAWENLKSTGEQVRANCARITAAEAALEGIKWETQAGLHTILDVLNAEQELLEARVALTKVEHDTRVVAFQLLVAVGRMTAQEIGLFVSL